MGVLPQRRIFSLTARGGSLRIPSRRWTQPHVWGCVRRHSSCSSRSTWPWVAKRIHPSRRTSSRRPSIALTMDCALPWTSSHVSLPWQLLPAGPTCWMRYSSRRRARASVYRHSPSSALTSSQVNFRSRWRRRRSVSRPLRRLI